MSKRKELQKQLKEAKDEYKRQFDYIASVSLDIDECESYLNPYFNMIRFLEKELEKYD